MLGQDIQCFTCQYHDFEINTEPEPVQGLQNSNVTTFPAPSQDPGCHCSANFSVILELFQ